MPDFPQIDGGEIEEIGAVTSGATTGTALTAGAVNVKGAWAQLVASTPTETSWVLVNLYRSSQHKHLVDIGIGAAAAEQVIIPNLGLQSVGSSADRFNASYLFPLTIPKGVRVSARSQASSAGQASRVTIHLIGSSFGSSSGLGRVTDYGTATADSGLTALDPGGTANTKGAWVQLTASTTGLTRWIAIGVGHDALAVAANQGWHVDIGIGASGSEQVLIPNLPFSINATSDVTLVPVLALPVHIPAGTRLAARCQCDVITATERLLDVAAWGVS